MRVIDARSAFHILYIPFDPTWLVDGWDGRWECFSLLAHTRQNSRDFVQMFLLQQQERSRRSVSFFLSSLLHVTRGLYKTAQSSVRWETLVPQFCCTFFSPYFGFTSALQSHARRIYEVERATPSWSMLIRVFMPNIFCRLLCTNVFYVYNIMGLCRKICT